MSQEPVFLAGPGLVPVRLLGLRDGRRTELLRDEATGRLYVMRTVEPDVPPLERARLAREGERQPDVRVHWEDSHLSVLRPYIPGRPLSDRLLAGGLLSVREAIKLSADVLGQLRPLHSAGRAHRDLRPDTIVLADTADGGAALVLDLEFVDAPALRRALREEAPAVGYLAPEQSGVIDRPVDARADLYSLGLILFESLSGKRPFDGADVRDVLHQHLSAPVPRVRALNPIVPRALDDYIARLLRKDPEDRHRDAAEALADLHRVAVALHSSRPGLDPGRTLTEARMAGRSAQLSALLRRAE
ncbi:MAG: hypothetical protein H0X00_12415, partial [Sporichthya sp.]|nr:hypothetical protein [Sporichthya sp.]